MPTNANTFNSRVTSEALEAKFRQVFPSQGGAELPQDLFASGVIQPVIDFSNVAEGSVLAQNLQTAWDFSTGQTTINGTTATLITNTGFWQVDLNATARVQNTVDHELKLFIDDGTSQKVIFEMNVPIGIDSEVVISQSNSFVVFLKAGESLKGQTSATGRFLDVWYRQIADVNGTLVNPLGFTFS